jgi:hypothetical protein
VRATRLRHAPRGKRIGVEKGFLSGELDEDDAGE